MGASIHFVVLVVVGGTLMVVGCALRASVVGFGWLRFVYF